MAETDSQYPETNNQAFDKEKIVAIFESVGIGSDPRVFDRIVQSVQTQHKIENSLFCGGEGTIAGCTTIIKTVPRKIDYLKWLPSENHTDAKRRNVEYGITCLISLTGDEKSYRGFATVSLLESAVQDVRIGYSNGMIIFEPTYYSKFGIVSKGGKVSPFANFSDINTSVDYFFQTHFRYPYESLLAGWTEIWRIHQGGSKLTHRIITS